MDADNFLNIIDQSSASVLVVYRYHVSNSKRSALGCSTSCSSTQDQFRHGDQSNHDSADTFWLMRGKYHGYHLVQSIADREARGACAANG